MMFCLVGGYHHSGGTKCLSEDGGNKLLLNVGNHPQDSMS